MNRRISKKRQERLFEDLANAVIIQAARDYRVALRKLDVNPGHKESQWIKEDCEGFFLSGWFGVLTHVDGDWLLNRLKKEFEDEKQERTRRDGSERYETCEDVS